MTWLSQWLNSTVTVRNAAIVADRFGDDRVDWAAATSVDVQAHVQDRTSVERTTDDQRTVQTATAFMPVDAPVLSTSRVVVDGVQWDVAGVLHRRFAGRSHLEVKLTRELEG